MSKVYEYDISSERQKKMKKYILIRDIPGCKKGTIFVHDEEDYIIGSPAYGCLKLAWTEDGDCQKTAPYCGGAFILHADVRNDPYWFEELECNKETIVNQIMTLLKKL